MGKKEEEQLCGKSLHKSSLGLNRKALHYPNMGKHTAVEVCPMATPKESKMTLESLEVSPALKHNLNKLYRVPLGRLNCSFGVVTRQGETPLKHMIESQARSQKANVVILLATRRPG